MKKNLGAFYDETSDFQQAQFNYLAKLIVETLPAEKIKTLLDVGAGTGARTQQCFELFPNLQHVTALEPDPDMYQQALDHHDDPRIQYLKKSASHLGQMDTRKRHFNAILSHWVMHWIREKEKLFKDFERVLNEYKRSYLMFSTCESLPRILQDVDTYIRIELGISPMGDNPFYYYNRRQWETLLSMNGWKIKALENFTVQHEVEDSAVYLEHWFTASTAKFTYNRHLLEIDETAREDLIYFM